MTLCDKTTSHLLSLIACFYGIFVYSIAFALEMWFIISYSTYIQHDNFNYIDNNSNEFNDESVNSDNNGDVYASIPVFAFILAGIYFITVIISLLLMLGIVIKSLICLMIWIITIVVLFFPECGLVLYMSIYKWGMERNGQIELCFYVVRGIMNLFFVVCVQSLLSQWKAEKQVSSYAMNISTFNTNCRVNDINDYFDVNSTTINPVFKYNTHTPTTEFDTRNFHEMLYKDNYLGSCSNIGITSEQYQQNNLPSSTSMTAYSTQSLDRRKITKLKHSNSFKDEIILRPLYHRPFDYLQRPGSVSNIREAVEMNTTNSVYNQPMISSRYRDYHENKSSTQSIRDVAL